MQLMRSLIIAVLLMGNILAQSPPEAQVLQKIARIFQSGEQVTFSSLYNSDQFNSAERQFVGRLYEIFFAIPAYLKDSQAGSGGIPTRAALAEHFDVTPQSIELLLAVMERDSRVPPLFTRDSAGEIGSLNIPNIEAFLARAGDNVRVTQWEGQPLPVFTLSTLEGEEFPSRKLDGKPTLIYFWFTGCPPCVRLAPILEELHKEYAPQGIEFLGINADDVLEIATTNQERLAYLEKQGLHFTNLNLDETVRQAFGNVNVFPTLFLVSADGTIQSHLINYQEKATLVAKLDALAVR